MRFDYDLVILGGTIAARQAALTAASWNARVALIEPAAQPLLGTHAIGIQQALVSVGQMMHRIQQAESFGIGLGREGAQPTVHWADALYWAQRAVENLEEERSPAVLAAKGVDVIVGDGEFRRRPHLAIGVEGRVLRSRRYLIATAGRAAVPPIEGLAQANPLTLDALWRLLPTLKPSTHLIVIGVNSISLELSQTLVRCGFQVTLVTHGDRLLPSEDADVVRLLQAQLEAEGIQILTQAEVTQVRQLGQQKWVQAGTRALEADQIILMADDQPDLEGLNLAAAGVGVTSTGVQVNAKLQTTHPRIYACGAALGHASCASIAHYEAEIALKNALGFPWFRVNYSQIPWVVATDPGIARLGLTESQARQQDGDRITVLNQPLKHVAKAQLQGNTTGFCKLIVRPNGQIVGAHIVSPEAAELMAAIAPLIRHQHSLQTLVSSPVVSLSLTEILYLAAVEWQHQQGDRHPWLRELRETWFNWRRS